MKADNPQFNEHLCKMDEYARECKARCILLEDYLPAQLGIEPETAQQLIKKWLASHLDNKKSAELHTKRSAADIIVLILITPIILLIMLSFVGAAFSPDISLPAILAFISLAFIAFLIWGCVLYGKNISIPFRYEDSFIYVLMVGAGIVSLCALIFFSSKLDIFVINFLASCAVMFPLIVIMKISKNKRVAKIATYITIVSAIIFFLCDFYYWIYLKIIAPMFP